MGCWRMGGMIWLWLGGGCKLRFLLCVVGLKGEGLVSFVRLR